MNGGLGRGERRHEGVGGRVERKGDSRVGLTEQKRASTGEDPRAARERHPAVASSSKRLWSGRGTGAVKATGFWEGSLPAEGIPGHFKRRLSRVGVAVVLATHSLSNPCVVAERRGGR